MATENVTAMLLQNLDESTNTELKRCARYIFASLILGLKRTFVKLGKIFFILLQKLFSFSRKSKFRILDIQISWHHQMPNHKTRNTFY